MTRTLVHRGPDGDGFWDAPGIALGMRRLAIIDPAGGHQPLRDESGDVIAVFNGELYNHAELRAGLERRGHRLRSGSDGEVIPHLYQEHGPRFVEQLNGIFAIALWDRGTQTLHLARDQFGVKPLYWARTGGRLAFASEIAALLSDDAIPRDVDPAAIDHFLTFRFVPSPRTALAAVRKLAPATVLSSGPDGVRETRYATTVPAGDRTDRAAAGGGVPSSVRTRGGAPDDERPPDRRDAQRRRGLRRGVRCDGPPLHARARLHGGLLGRGRAHGRDRGGGRNRTPVRRRARVGAAGRARVPGGAAERDGGDRGAGRHHQRAGGQLRGADDAPVGAGGAVRAGRRRAAGRLRTPPWRPAGRAGPPPARRAGAGLPPAPASPGSDAVTRTRRAGRARRPAAADERLPAGGRRGQGAAVPARVRRRRPPGGRAGAGRGRAPARHRWRAATRWARCCSWTPACGCPTSC